MIYYQMFYTYQPQVAAPDGDKRSWWKWTFASYLGRMDHYNTFRDRLHDVYFYEIDIAEGETDPKVLDQVIGANSMNSMRLVFPRDFNPVSRVHLGALPAGAARKYASEQQYALERAGKTERGPCGRWAKAARENDR